MKLLKLAICFCIISVVLSTVNSKWRGSQRKPFSVRRKYPTRLYSSSYSIRRSGLSRSQTSILFSTVGALGGIYIASRMRPHVRLRSYRDLEGYTVCEGKRLYMDNRTTTNYKYFLCPEDINQPFNRYCCVDGNGFGVCCSYDQRSGSIIGSVAGVIIFGLVIGVLVWCCCYRRRRSQKSPDNSAVFVTPATGVPAGSGYDPTIAGQPSGPAYPGSYVPPYPSQPAVPKAGGLPYPAAYPTSPYPQAPLAPQGGYGAAQPPALSSGWGVPDATAAATTTPNADFQGPPPPYSAAVGTAPYPPN